MAILRRIQADNGVVFYRSPALAEVGVPHAFATRIGGISQGPYATLNLGNPGENARPGNCPLDEQANIDTNFRRLRQTIHCEAHALLTVRQVHGCGVLDVTPETSAPAEADAMVTDQRQALLAIRVADCVPILLATEDGRAVAAIHAGWRGLVAGVIARTVAHLAQRSDARPETLRGAVGPAIGLDRFEVGHEVAQAFVDAGLGAAVSAEHGHKPHVHLGGAAMHQLKAAGLCGTHLDETDRCTFRDAAEFFSHRRDLGCTGRNAAVIATA